MDIPLSNADIAALLTEVLGANLEDLPDAYSFGVDINRHPTVFLLPKPQLQNAIDELSKCQEEEETAVFSPRSYEVLVAEAAPRQRVLSPFRLREEQIEKTDPETGIQYTLGRPTDQYFIFALMRLSNFVPLGILFRAPLSYRLRRLVEQAEPAPDALAAAKAATGTFRSLRLDAAQDTSLQTFVDLANAFLFQLSYNLDVSVVPVRSFEEFGRATRLGRLRRARVEDIDPPRRTYIPDLVYYYQMAVASDSPLLQYLSYYHIAEYFFESVFQDELIEKVRTKLTQPDFSYRRKKDIKALIADIARTLRLQGETMTFNEQEALRLTLAKFVPMAELSRRVTEYDPDLVRYYRDTKVPFSNGDAFDLNDQDPVRAVHLLASRIYKTRNAIVHSKEGERVRYVPFRHDRLLAREVPLLRFTSEIIVTETSSILE